MKGEEAMNSKRMILLSVLAVMSVSSLHAQLVNGRFTTSFYTLERFDTVGSSRTYLRAFQSVQLSMAQGNVSLNTFLQGAVNGANDFGDNGRVRFYNLYLRWADIGRIVDLSVGRQAVYAGVGNGTIDGLMARAKFLDNRLTLTGYGGSTVNSDYTGVQKNWHDNVHVGGQIVTTALPGARIGVSYMNRHEEVDPYWTLRARDTSFVPVPYYIANQSTAVELGSADASYSKGELFSVYGRYDYDFNFKETARGQGGVKVSVTPELALTGDVIYRRPHISYNSIFSAFTSNSTTVVDGGVEYGFSPLLRAFGKVGYVSYTDDKSMRWTAGLNAMYGSVSYTGGSGYAGELTSFSLQGAYPLFNRMLVPTLGVSYASYRLSADADKDNALSLLLGATVRPSKNFSFDVQGQWMKNAIYDRDMRLQVKLMYWFAERLSLFSEEVQ